MSGGRHLFTVEDSFTIEHRGVVILPGLALEGSDVFRVGDPLELCRPDGSLVRTHIAGLPMFSRPPSLTHVPVLLSGELKQEDVPVGTDVWSVHADTTESLRGGSPEYAERSRPRNLTVRQMLNRRIRRVLGLFLIGLGLVPAAILTGAAVGKEAAAVLVVAAVGLSVGMMLYNSVGGIKSPCCGANWVFVLNTLGYPYSRSPRMSVPPSIRFCPFCGTAIDDICEEPADQLLEKS